MVKLRNFLLLIGFFSFSTSFAQDTFYFKKGLSANGLHRYGREALYTDKLAYQFFTNTLKTPVEGGESGGANRQGEPVKWQSITADSLNRFRGRGFGGFGGGGSYAYFTYESDREKTALLNIVGNSAVIINGEMHTGDPYGSGWMYIPVRLKKGLNELYVRQGGFMIARLIFPKTPVQLNTEDLTLPFIVAGEDNSALKGAVVVINTTNQSLKNYVLKANIGGKEVETAVPVVPPMSTRKVPFGFNAGGITETGLQSCSISLISKGKIADTKTIRIESVGANDKYSRTFESNIDGSLQYYAVSPQTPSSKEPSALFLSVHGAGVEAIGQARAYKQKDWGTLVAATNRRPRGFNWEDWGRIDALEVLAIAKDKFKPDPKRIYLTGHSMGGHGTWFLGATYPDLWAAIAPCAGYPTLKGYGSADGLIPEKASTDMGALLLRTSNQSDVPKLANNYQPLGVYIFHGDSDRTVSVNYARQMRKQLGEFHKDMSYYEFPGGSHWFGDQSVDWKPIFDFFKWHTILPDSAMNHIDFTTASPGISAKYRWISIEQQQQPLEYSRIRLTRNKSKAMIKGSTENVYLLKVDLGYFGSGVNLSIQLDSLNTLQYTTKTSHDSIYLVKSNGQWTVTAQPGAEQKGPHRYGTFKDPFNHRMVFIYGTKGNAAENKWNFDKARFDAETWYYRGNGAVDIISDKEYNAAKYSGRNVIIYGNASTNAAYQALLADCPIRVERNAIKAGEQAWTGDDLATYFTWPIRGTEKNSVGVIAGTGLKGMQAAYANQYFAGASGFPDFMIFGTDMMQDGVKGVRFAGFFDHQWKLVPANFAKSNQ
jgi:poly(3-hydroxybutyrate) depolymerase